MPSKRLTIIPSVPVWTDQDILVFDRKFYDGILMYVQAWSGPVTCLCHQANSVPPSFDVVRKTSQALPFDVKLLGSSGRVETDHLQEAAIVMASADEFNQLHVSALCRQLGIPCVYVIEYIPETRYQIVAIEARNFLIRWRQNLFVWQTERKRLAAFKVADGLQCNGVAAYNYYHDHLNSLLYFDTRTRRDSLISDGDLSLRLSHLSAGHPIRLAFSGRLIGMKGADHLILVARKLRDHGVAFHMTIYGKGELEAQMHQDLQHHQLNDQVSMPGSVDFDSHLIPEIKSSVDLYIMLHRQSDPSCTYLETLGCGIPIVGYANKAFAGILNLANVGLSVPMDDIDGVVSAVERLAADRASLIQLSLTAAKFSRAHSFEDTFSVRVEHLRTAMQATGAQQPLKVLETA